MADVSKVKLNGTAYNVKDASVPSWAKQSSKPSYTQDEVGDGSTYKRVTSTEKTTWNNKGTYSKPSGGIPKSDLASAVQTSLERADTALQSFTESDPTVPSWAKQSSKPLYTASEVGAIATSAKGAANGVASLDSAGKVPSSQLPSYVDDVLEYSAKSSFPSTGETGKIYVDTSTNKTYRWSGSAYVEISASLALGETSSTAYAGDKGKTAYSHATETRLTTATASGLYKVASTAQGHIASLTAVAKADITALGIPAQDTTYGVVSTSANGLAPKVTDTSKFLKGDGTWATPANTWTAMVGATSSANGSVGYVNATPPKDGYNTKYLRADGSWQVPPNTTYSAATQSANGLMSSTDKTKLDGIATGATANIGTVTQVKVGSTAYNPSSGVVSLPAYPTTLPASDVSSWAKASSKPSYTYSEVGAASSSHTHNYAGSSSAGGAATSANKLNTNAGSATNPVYFSNGVPVATTYSLGKSVPSNAVFTDTHRAIKVDGTQVLASNSTALNFIGTGHVHVAHDSSNPGNITFYEENWLTFIDMELSLGDLTWTASSSSPGLYYSGNVSVYRSSTKPAFSYILGATIMDFNALPNALISVGLSGTSSIWLLSNTNAFQSYTKLNLRIFGLISFGEA